MEYITFETSKLAKKKGYVKEDEYPCLNQYELMDWLREKHNIYISIRPYVTMATKDKVGYDYVIFTTSDGINFAEHRDSEDAYLNHNDCLEHALREALNMI